MNKSELTEILGAKLFITRSDAERFLNFFIQMIYEQLAGGGKISIHGFGQFSAVYRAPHAGINPRKDFEPLVIAERNVPKFVAGQEFKKAVKA